MLRHRRITRTVVIVGIVTAAVCVAGCQRPGGFHFDLAADMRDFTMPDHAGVEHFAGVCRALRDLGPGAFMVVPGDLDPPDRVRKTLDAVLGAEYVMYPVVGNHELEDPSYMEYLRAYNRDGTSLPDIVNAGPPGARETCYSFDYENAHFAVVNEYYDGGSDATLDGDVNEALLAWLADDLAANRQPIVFVVGHEPHVSIPDLTNGRVRHRGDSLDQYPERNHRFWTLLRRHNVVAYICGHSHNASVSKINGVWQIDCGHARGLGDPGAPSTFIKVHVEPDAIWCRVYRAELDSGFPYRLAFEERLR